MTLHPRKPQLSGRFIVTRQYLFAWHSHSNYAKGLALEHESKYPIKFRWPRAFASSNLEVIQGGDATVTALRRGVQGM